MKLIPAIDLKDNKCVRLIKGEEQSAILYNTNPVEQAKYFEGQGCERIHIIDLDAAFGRPKINRETITNIGKSVKIPIQLGGGIRSKEDAKFWLENNIEYLIIGSLAITQSSLVKEIAEEFQNKIYIAMDVLGFDEVMIKGWVENSKLRTKNVHEIYCESKIKGYILTDIDKDGTMEGLDKNFIEKHLNIYNKPMILSGGLNSHSDLKLLLHLNSRLTNNNKIEGVIVGKAFYSGKLEIKKALNIINKYA